ncbi:MAG: ATP synthase F0 subunit C [Terriglobales bacterium]
MPRRFWQFATALAALMAATPLLAQAAPAAAGHYSPATWAAPLAAVIGLGIAAGLCGIGQGLAAAAAAEGAARNPGAWNFIRFALILGLVFTESLTLYVFVIVFIKT